MSGAQKTLGQFGISIRWLITSNCNLNCRHCCFRGSNTDTGGSLSANEWLGSIDQIRKHRQINGIQILGGEPFSRNDIMTVLRGHAERGIQTSLITNGVILPSEFFADIDDLHVSEVTFSIDGPSPEVYGSIRDKNLFMDVIKNVKRLLRARRKTRVKVNYVLMATNVDSVEYAVEYFNSIGVDTISFNLFEPRGNGETNRDELEISTTKAFDCIEKVLLAGRHRDITIQVPLYPLAIAYMNKLYGLRLPMQYRGCVAGSMEVLILPDGNVAPCAAFLNRPWIRDFLGFEPLSILELPLETIIEMPAYQRFLEAKRSQKYKDYRPCNKCQYLGNWCEPCFFEGYIGRDCEIEMCAEVIGRQEYDSLDVEQTN